MIYVGSPGKMRGFPRAMDRRSLIFDEVGPIIVTHSYWDHIGSASVIRDLTGTKEALHREEKAWLEKLLKRSEPEVTTRGTLLAGVMGPFFLG